MVLLVVIKVYLKKKIQKPLAVANFLIIKGNGGGSIVSFLILKQMNPYVFNFINGATLCTIGFWSNSFDFPFAYYFVGLGILLIFLTYFVQKSIQIPGTVAMMSTLLATAVLGYLFYTSLGEANPSQTPLGIMLTSGIITSAAFVQCAVNHKGEEAKACCGTPAEGAAKTGCC